MTMLRARLEAHELEAYGVPEHLQGGLLRYLNDRIRPGQFLCSVLMNDLREAVSRADVPALLGLRNIVTFLNMEAPAPAWGSPDAFALPYRTRTVEDELAEALVETPLLEGLA